MGESSRSLTSGRVLARSAFWNLFGMAAPMVVAVIAIPLLISGMGTERFGLLAIIWMGIGYFSLFDLGLGRALTKLVSSRLGQANNPQLGPLIWTAFYLLFALGAIGSIFLLAFSGPLIRELLNVPEKLHAEGVAAFRVLAIGLPIVIVTAGLIGLLQAHQRFGAIAAVRVPLGVLSFLGPLVTLQFTPSIAWATVVLLGGRVVSLILFYVLSASVRDELRRPEAFDYHQVGPLLTFGGWLTVTNIVGPIMTYMDRVFIGSVMSMSAVAYYVTPYEVLSRLKMVPNSVMGVLFPAMATAYSGGGERLAMLYNTSSRVIYWAMFPLMAGAFLLAPEALQIWLGEEFSSKSTPVVHLLAVGWLVNTLANPALTVLQSTGRPDLVAKVHLAELVPYLGALWWFVSMFGIVGAAGAWTIRIVADALILNAITAKTLPELRSFVTRSYAAIGMTLVVFGSFWLIDSLAIRFAALLAVLAGSFVFLWPIAKRAILGRAPRQGTQSGSLD